MTRNDDRRATVTSLEAADAVGRLIAQAGRRAQPPVDAEASVRDAVYGAWREEVARRSWRRHLALAMAATIAALAAGIGWQLTMHAQSPAVVAAATLQHAFGPVSLKTGDGLLRTVVADGETTVHAGEAVMTGIDAGARMLIAGLAEVRVAAQSRMTVIGPDHVRLEAGALFVDSGAGVDSLVIDTPFGSVEHIGTRYQVRVTPDATTIMVRDGKVRLARGTSSEVAGTEEQLVAKAGGWITRSHLPAYGDAWRWVDSLATVPRIDGLALADFLDWVANETGRHVDYTTSDAAASARTTILHGSVEGLSPEQALKAVLATATDLSAEIVQDRVVVERDPDYDR